MKRVIIFISILAGLHLNSQNLVLNPGFEEHGEPRWTGIGLDYFQFYDVKNWWSPTQGSSDYFFGGKNGNTDFMDGYAGKVAASEGSAFAGIIPWHSQKEYREYLGGELKEKLVKGREYTFSIKVCTGKTGMYLVNELGVVFREDHFTLKGTKSTLHLKPQIKLDASVMNSSAETWTTLTGTFIASGNEKYFLFGNFANDRETKINTRPISYGEVWSYLYVDEVSLTGRDLSVVIQTDTVAPPPVVIVPGPIYFASGSSELSSASKAMLAYTAELLMKDQNLMVLLDAYTDSVGSQQDNLELALKRGNAAADHLVSLGVSKDRVKFRAFGESHPASKTQLGLNRRVEILLEDQRLVSGAGK